MRIPGFLRQRRWQALIAVGVLVAVVAALGGFTRSDYPLPTIDANESIELGQYELAVSRARIVDVDDEGEPFDDGLARVIVTTKVTNTSDETTAFGEGLLGVADQQGQRYENETESSSFHPGLEREVDISVPVPVDRLTGSGTIDIWLGARIYSWTNLAMPGPAWSVPNWAAIVTDVPVDDQRGASK